jgi:RNA polymerase sigma-70 factor (ECF subfamily)
MVNALEPARESCRGSPVPAVCASGAISASAGLPNDPRPDGLGQMVVCVTHPIAKTRCTDGCGAISECPEVIEKENGLDAVYRIGMATSTEQDDEELMRRLAEGDASALAPLYERYAALIFAVARDALDQPAAEEIVQDVLVAAWRKARTYDPARGAVRPWLLQMTRTRVINELRRRGRRPATVSDPRDLQLAAVPDNTPEPDEAIWREFRRSAVQEAVATLPEPQAQALRLAYFDELSHTQVAEFLGVPLGTAKTRIRTGMQRLQGALRPLVTLLVVGLVGVATLLGVRFRQERARQERIDSALTMVVSSDSVTSHLSPAPGVAPDAHGNYRTAPGADLAVLTLSHLPPAPAGEVYRVWARYGSEWVSLGVATPNAQGHTMMIVDQRASGSPDTVEVTLEPSGSAPATPGTNMVVSWSAS